MKPGLWRRLWRSEIPGRAAAVVLLVVTVGLLGGALAARAAEGPPITTPPHHGVAGLEQVTKGLMCTCGCNLTVNACEAAMTCSVAPRMKEDAARKLAEGMSPKAVLASFARDYGEGVLSAPPKRGFNLMVWVLPFVALGIGTLVVGGSLHRWRAPRPDDEPAPAPVDDTYAALVERAVAEELS